MTDTLTDRLTKSLDQLREMTNAEALNATVLEFKDSDPISALLLLAEIVPFNQPYGEEDLTSASLFPLVLDSARKKEADSVAFAEAHPCADPMPLAQCLSKILESVTAPCAFRDALLKAVEDETPKPKDRSGMAPAWLCQRTHGHVPRIPASPLGSPKMGS